MKYAIEISGIFAVIGAASCQMLSRGDAGEETAEATYLIPIVTMPLANSNRGRDIFVKKGCFICHSVNGVGGRASTPLDAEGGMSMVDPIDFAARMWRGAYAMAQVQELEIGYQIDLTGEEIAHLSAFVADAEVQRRFSEGDIPELLRDWIIDEPYWIEDDWGDYP